MKTPSGPIGFNRITTNNFNRAIAFLVAVAALDLYLQAVPGVFASTGPGAGVATGIIRVAGMVTVDGDQATSWQTIFPGSRIATFAQSESIIDLGKFTRFRLSADSELMLDFSRTNIAGSLSNGTVRAFIPAGVPVSIKTADVELTTDSSQPATFILQTDGETTKVSVETGRVNVGPGDRLQSVSGGQVFATASGLTAPAVTAASLASGRKIGLFVAIATAAGILAIAIIGRD